jgi:Yip1 domain.
MAKFCTKCGKSLEEGKTCTCAKNAPVQNANKDLMTTILDVAKGMFTKPVDTMKSFIDDNNFNAALIILGIVSLVASFVTCLAVKELSSLITSIMTLSNPLGSLGSVPEINYAKVFFQTLLAAAVMFASLSGILYVVADKMFKGKTSFKKIVTLLAAANIIMIATLLVSLVFMYVSAQLMLIVIVFGSALYSCYTYQGLKLGVKIDENKLAYIYAISIMVLFVVFGIILPNVMM